MTFITAASARSITRKKIKSTYTYHVPLSTLHGIHTILLATGFLQHPWRPQPCFSALRILQAQQ